MGKTFMIDLIYNASLLLGMGIVYNTFFIGTKKNSTLNSIFIGAFAGMVGILLMLNAVPVSDGVFFDSRSILISVTGLFMGAIPTSVSVLIISVYRLMMGGSGALTGVLVTVVTGAIGLLWRRYRFESIRNADKVSALAELYFFGLFVHACMLLCMLTLPDGRAVFVLEQIALPVLLVFPVAVLLLCIVIHTRMANLRMEADLRERDRQLYEMIEQAPVGVTVAENRLIRFVNPAFEQIVGRTAGNIIELGWSAITHPDDLEVSREQNEKLLSGEVGSYDLEKRYLKPDGTIVWVYINVVALKRGGLPTGQQLCIIRDITDIVNEREEKQRSDNECRKLYKQYQEKQRLLASLLDSIPDLIFYKDTELVYIGCNKAFEAFAGRSEEELVGHTDFELFGPEMASLFREMDLKMMEQKTQRRNEELVTYPDGSKVFLETLKTPYFDDDGRVLGLIGVSRDITQRKEKEAEILYLNYHDVMTGLYNRTYFEQAKYTYDTVEQLPLAVIIGDINGLKLINDAFGYAEGDRLLQNIAGILTRNCRSTDVVARTGGDEFTILLPKTSYEEADRLLARIRKECGETVVKSGEAEYRTSISLGFAVKTNEDVTFERILRLAEEHMYRQKLLQQQSLHSSIINSIKRTMFEKSNETEEHAERMAVQARRLGEAIGLKEEDLVTLQLLATLHDIGKISVDREILTKTGPLNDTEWLELKKHPEVGYRITNASPELRHVSKYILYHHERWDGNGYPHKLRGEKIPLLSRIITIVDAYDAMTQGRPYKKAMTEEEATQELLRNAGTQFDPNIVRIFVEQVLPGERIPPAEEQPTAEAEPQQGGEEAAAYANKPYDRRKTDGTL